MNDATTIDVRAIAAAAIQNATAAHGDKQTIETIARACHAANGSYCKAIGDDPQLPWAQAAESSVAGVMFRLANPLSTPADQHSAWLADKERDGWKFGPVKDPVKKEHPCFVPYSELPEAQRAKDFLFITVVDGLKGKLAKDVYEGTPDARQSEEAEVQPAFSLFRKRYRQLSPDEVALHDQIKDKADELYALFLQVSNIEGGPDANRERGANVALAKRHLEDAVYRAVKGLTS
jgi:hypothetical protein